jgi:hypothetical protein
MDIIKGIYEYCLKLRGSIVKAGSKPYYIETDFPSINPEINMIFLIPSRFQIYAYSEYKGSKKSFLGLQEGILILISYHFHIIIVAYSCRFEITLVIKDVSYFIWIRMIICKTLSELIQNIYLFLG